MGSLTRLGGWRSGLKQVWARVWRPSSGAAGPATFFMLISRPSAVRAVVEEDVDMWGVLDGGARKSDQFML